MEGGECNRLIIGLSSETLSHLALPQQGQEGTLWGLDELILAEVPHRRAARIVGSAALFFACERNP